MTSAALHPTSPLPAPALRLLRGTSLPARLVLPGSPFIAGGNASAAA